MFNIIKRIQDFTGLTNEEQVKRLGYNIILYTGIIFCYTILRVSKDVMSISVGQGSGILSFLKSYVTLPLSFAALWLFGSLSNNYKRSRVFEIVMTSFASFFLLYAYVLGPNREFFHIAPATAQRHITFLTQFQFLNSGPLFASIYKNVFCTWTVSLFYAAAELFGTLCISQLFWGFMMATNNKATASRTFPVYQLMSSVGSILTAWVSNLLVKRQVTGMQTEIALWDQNLKNVTLSIVMVIAVCLYCHRLSNASAAEDTDIGAEKEPKKKLKLTFLDSAKIVFRSPVLVCIAMIVITYGISMALVENVIKNYVGKLSNFNTTGAYALAADNIGLQGIVQIVIGVLCYKWMSRAKWEHIAIITPITFALGGLVFFSAGLMPAVAENLTRVANGLGTSLGLNKGTLDTLAIVANIGLFHGLLVKTAKYTFLDVARERSYLLLNDEEKTLGKAAVDVLGSRIGKASGGFLISTLLLPIFGGGVHLPGYQQIDNITPYIATLYGVCVLLMSWAIWKLISIYREKEFDAGNVPTTEPVAIANTVTADMVTARALTTETCDAHNMTATEPVAIANMVTADIVTASALTTEPQ